MDSENFAPRFKLLFMPLVLELPAETEQLLREAAKRAGREVEQFVLEAATEKVGRANQILTPAQAAALLGSSPAHIERLLESKRLASLSAEDVAFYGSRLEAANRALDEIVAMTEAAGLYDHQK